MESERNLYTTERMADDFCEAIRRAAQLAQLTKQLKLVVQDAANDVIRSSMFDQLPFRLEVSIPAGVSAYIAHDDEVVDSDPKTFIASEIRSISEHGIEFYDRQTDQWLRIDGHDFEVSPVFESDQPTPE